MHWQSVSQSVISWQVFCCYSDSDWWIKNTEYILKVCCIFLHAELMSSSCFRITRHDKQKTVIPLLHMTLLHYVIHVLYDKHAEIFKILHCVPEIMRLVMSSSKWRPSLTRCVIGGHSQESGLTLHSQLECLLAISMTWGSQADSKTELHSFTFLVYWCVILLECK